jgi:hypothetical protein
MASFTNLALSLSQLGAKYMNQIYTVNREVADVASGEIKIAADYSELGYLLMTVTLIGLMLPIMTIYIVKRTRFQCA